MYIKESIRSNWPPTGFTNLRSNFIFERLTFLKPERFENVNFFREIDFENTCVSEDISKYYTAQDESRIWFARGRESYKRWRHPVWIQSGWEITVWGSLSGLTISSASITFYNEKYFLVVGVSTITSNRVPFDLKTLFESRAG